jgi:membrane protease YdiL (CAAX protease family)
VSNIKVLVHRYPLATFVILTFAISWLPALITAIIPIPGFEMLVFAAGPSVAAVIMAAIEGKAARSELWSRAVRWRVGWGWYAVAIVSPLPFFLAAIGLNTLLGAPVPTAVQWAAWPGLFATIASFLFIPLRGAWEEAGWRGYALPKLLSKYNALTASLILGVIWALWHLPLLLAGQTNWALALLVIPLSVIFTWLFKSTNGSVLLAFLFHAFFDSFGEYFIPMVTGADQTRLFLLLTALATLIAIVIVIITGRALWRPSKMQLSVRVESASARA